MPLIMHHVMDSIMLSMHHYLRVVHVSEKARVDQVSEKGLPPVMLMPSWTSVILLQF